MSTVYHDEQKLMGGQIQNPGAIYGVVDFAIDQIDLKNVGSESEKEAIEAALSTAIFNLKPANYKPRMTFDAFHIDALIGSGSWGRVWKAEGKNGIGQVALKQQPINYLDLPNFWKERDMMIKLKHPRICTLLGAFVHTDIFFVMELCHGSVAHLRNRIDGKNAARFSIQLLQAIDWIHSKQCVHADIKPDNCLINTKNNLVLCDFGSAITLSSKAVVMSESHGSPGYMDYEANKFLNFETHVDVFAAACVIFEMDTKSPLLAYNVETHSRELYVDAFENGRISGYREGMQVTDYMERATLAERAIYSEDYAFLIQKMICDRKTRITAKEALVDPTIISICRRQSLDISNLKSDDFVSKEFVKDHGKKFQFFGQGDVDQTSRLALISIYYDYKDYPRAAKRKRSKTPVLLSNLSSSSEPE